VDEASADDAGPKPEDGYWGTLELAVLDHIRLVLHQTT
jgi:hypothetical protein